MQQTLAQLCERENPMRLIAEIDELLRGLERMAILDSVTKETLSRKSRVLERIGHSKSKGLAETAL